MSGEQLYLIDPCMHTVQSSACRATLALHVQLILIHHQSGVAVCVQQNPEAEECPMMVHELCSYIACRQKVKVSFVTRAPFLVKWLFEEKKTP